MPADSKNIYGIDENSLASSIASDALSAPNPNAYSGAPLDQEARSVSSKGHSSSAEGDGREEGIETNNSAVKTKLGVGNDSRKASRGN